VTPAELLAAHDAQLRAHVPTRLPDGESVDLVGPLVRFSGGFGRGWVLYRDLDGIEGDALDELIAAQVAYFAERGQRFEWKTYAHDRPADLAERLLAAGFVAEEPETVVIATVDGIAGDPQLPDGVRLRDITARADLEKIDGLEAAVWGEDEDEAGYADFLESELAVDPDALAVVVAEAGDTVVSAAWVRFLEGTEFACFFGGATLEEWRGRGIYRATVTHRANLAAARGCRYLQTDASDDSRPILERLGFVAVTTTTPYLWSPRA
jgi:GNAT superfamily N-acetyltransferase